MVLVLCWSAAPRDPLLLSDASVSGSVPAKSWRSVVIRFVWVVSSCCVVLGWGLIVPSAAPGWRSPVPVAAWGPWCSIRPRRGEGVPRVTSRILVCYVIHSATMMSLRKPPLQISTEITTLSLAFNSSFSLLHDDWLSVLFISIQSGRSSSQTGTNGTFLLAADASASLTPFSIPLRNDWKPIFPGV